MSIFCGLPIQRRSHSKRSKSPAEPRPSVSTWSPPRPPREDGHFGLPPPPSPPMRPCASRPLSPRAVRPYPPARSPLRHKSERLPRGQRPSDLGHTLSAGPAVTGQFRERSPDVVEKQLPPMPLRRSSHSIADYVVRELPRYGRDSRPPVSGGSFWVRSPHSHSTPLYHPQPISPQRRDPETESERRMKRRSERWGPPPTPPPSRPLPVIPQTYLTPSPRESRGAVRPYPSDNEPIYFAPKFHSVIDI
ncbi:hypothetical protein DL765_003772 [Monosporascus sp. GIB2]|nr:hypothetical protein DL765_003772 [Monosporascus sp. GIB2]